MRLLPFFLFPQKFLRLLYFFSETPLLIYSLFFFFLLFELSNGKKQRLFQCCIKARVTPCLWVWSCDAYMDCQHCVNCGRRFWKCKNSGEAATCDLFVWDDELDFETMRMVSVSEGNEDLSVSEATQRVCQCKCGQISKEWESKKIAKLKLKLCDERKKTRWMHAFVVLVSGVSLSEI